SARIVAYPGLARDIEKYRHILGGRGIDVLCDIFRCKYHGKAYPDSYTGREREVFQIAQEKAADGNMLNVPVNSFHPKGKRCNAGRNIGIVFPGGEVQPCYYLFKNMGNIYTGIAFNDSDVTCPFEYCSCPLYAYGPGHLKKYQDAFKYALVTYRGYGRHGKNGRREKKNR
ncbi:MAG: hypothetical protein WCG78_08370, partial [Candidatus Omnitrophota bacterium]